MTNKPKFLLVYGSQTGQAEAIAEDIRDNASEHVLEAQLHCMDKTDKKFNLDRVACAVIIVSTTGEGDPPDNAQKLYRRLKKRTLPSDYLGHLNYALLGLGDSNYVSFCECGKNFNRRLEELGAKRFYPCAWADDAVGLEIAVEPWIEGLWSALRKHLGLCSEEPTENGSETIRERTDDNPLTENKTIRDPDVDRTEQNTEQKTTIIKNGEITSGSGDTKSSNCNMNGIISNNSGDGDHSKTHQNVVQQELLSKPNETVAKDSNEGLLSCETLPQESTDIPDGKQDMPSLTRSVPPLSESGLTLPPLSAPYLRIEYTDKDIDVSNLPHQNGTKLPSSASQIHEVLVNRVTQLTREDAIKTALEVELSIEGTGLEYQPGDAFSVICPNSDDEVSMLINRLNIADVCDRTYSLSILPDTKKRNASLPSHLHPESTLRYVLTTCCDIREPPKKAFLRMLVEHTTDPVGKRRLQELCCKQGAEDYTSYIREAHVGILDILFAFETCQPPIERLLEHLPRLQPRPYSASSSPLHQPGKLTFVFNVIEVPEGKGRAYSRQGVCTGWLALLGKVSPRSVQGEPLVDDMKNLSLAENKAKIPIFLRTNQHFRLPEDPSLPVIMIGPGTGVAPFVGFLRQRESEAREQGTKCGKMWLFYGCRHKDRDYLYQEQLEGFKSSGLLTQLSVSFSRDGGEIPKYVQDNLKNRGVEVLNWICDENAVVYVCGDAKNMSHDVNETFIQLLRDHRGVDDGKGFMMKLRLNKLYHEDVWT